jgi:hypothetical protein
LEDNGIDLDLDLDMGILLKWILKKCGADCIHLAQGRIEWLDLLKAFCKSKGFLDQLSYCELIKNITVAWLLLGWLCQGTGCWYVGAAGDLVIDWLADVRNPRVATRRDVSSYWLTGRYWPRVCVTWLHYCS